MAIKSGLTSKPCLILPYEPGKAPPPCANATLSLGNFQNSTENHTTDRKEVSAGIPTNQGNQ